MASEAENILPQPVQGIDRLCAEYRKILNTSTRLLPFRGASLTQPDLNLMDIQIIDAARNNFWKSADAQTKDGLKSGLKSTLGDIQSSLDNYRNYKEELAESRSPTMAIAYTVSRIYIACLLDLLEDGLFHNEALLDESEDSRFQNLGYVHVSAFLHDVLKLTLPRRISYFRSYINMETHVAFVTPGQPHVTIVSVQPQLAPSQKELLCTEIRTLYYWANKLISRALHVTGHYLPVCLCYSALYSWLMNN